MKFSCLIASYFKDCPSQLQKALDSLERQTLPATEIVLVEDGPLSEELYRIVDEYKLSLPIKIVQLKENKGLGTALNIGLQKCSYDIVFRMDTDDICEVTRFEKQIEFLVANPNVDIVGTWTKDIDDRGEIIGERTFPTEHGDILDIIWSCPFAHPTVAFRRKPILKIGSYRTDIKRRQDYDLWMRAAASGLRFANIPEYLLYYRFTDDYYKKNNLKVAWQQAMMGYRGLRKLKVKSILPYFAVFTPVARGVMPDFLAKPFHTMISKIDPRKKYN